jgi:hypothetical protein
MLDGLPFLHYLHNILLDHSLCRSQSLFETLCEDGPDRPDRPSHRLGGGNVLCLKALGALLHFKFNSLALVQRLVTVHLNRGEVHENIFPGLALDETKALRRIEPLNCSLFFHFHYLNIGTDLPSAVTSPRPQKKAAKFVLAAP